MKKNKCFYILLIGAFLLIGNKGFSQFKKELDNTDVINEKKTKKNNNFKSDKFSGGDTYKPSDMQHIGPPPPPSPISGGLWILLIGSAVYITSRIREEKKK